MDSNHPLSERMRSEFEISLEDWLTLAMFLLTTFVTQPRARWIGLPSFAPLKVSAATVVAFLASISTDLKGMRDHLRQIAPPHKHESEYREVTPLIRYPLVVVSERYHRTTLPVLIHSLQHFLYDRFRAFDANWFMTSFGPLFERYVENCLAASGETYMNEAQISQTAGPGKTVDFLIKSAASRVFADAKGVELRHNAMTSYSPDYILRAAESSVLKGILQGLSTADRLRGLDSSEYAPENCYLLVVTYKDLILSGGHMLVHLLGHSRLTELTGREPSSWPIPPEHIYFVGIEDFENACGAIERRDTTFSDLLTHAVTQDSEPATRKLLFHQHIADLAPNRSFPSILDDAWNKKFKDLEAIHP
ncbi:MAG: hypothetical protein JJ896_17520 [Rhodothermales bacterium]|nr:hypothetical protein [Rhodothermales bacterium]